MKNNRKNDSYSTSAWPAENKSAAWQQEETHAHAPAPPPADDEPTPAGYAKYRAVFEFSARNADEITFQPGDIVMVSFPLINLCDKHLRNLFFVEKTVN